MPTKVIVDLVTDCNLKCPQCVVHGSGSDKLDNYLRRKMPYNKAVGILSELKESKPLVMPSMWSEPTLYPYFMKFADDAKCLGLPIAMNTNGLKVTIDLAEFFCDIEFDSVFVSVDAATSDTLKKVRGMSNLATVHRAVFALLEVRGDRKLPRIGVSMTLQESNRHERDEFVNFWKDKVDVVRIGEVWEDGRFKTAPPQASRKPCPSLYSTLAINVDGRASICCLDSFGGTDMGNVFDKGVKAVWHGEKLTEARRLHEDGRAHEIPICKNCDRWASYDYTEEVANGMLVRKSYEYTYYNRLDKLDSWTKEVSGTHKRSGWDAKGKDDSSLTNPGRWL